MLTIEKVKKLALENYTKGGDRVFECWEDSDIQEWLDEGNTLEDLYKLFALYKDVEEDRMGW